MCQNFINFTNSQSKLFNSELTMTPNQACAVIMKTVNESNLNFQVNQTPYSCYISIRKKFLKDEPEQNPESESLSDNEALKNQNSHLKLEYQKLLYLYNQSIERNSHLEYKIVDLESELKSNQNFQKSYEAVKNDLDDATEECEMKEKAIQHLETIRDNIHQKIIEYE